MRIGDLIEELQKLDPTMRVMLADEDGGVRREVVSVERVGANKKCTAAEFAIRARSCSTNMVAVVAAPEPERFDDNE